MVLKVTYCHAVGHYCEQYAMTETVPSLGRGGTAAAMAQDEQTTEERSVALLRATVKVFFTAHELNSA